MKKRLMLYTVMSICIGVTALTGCRKNNPPVTPAEVDLSISANIAAMQTKAAWNDSDEKVVWKSGDAIGVFVGTDSNVKLTLGQGDKFAGKLAAAPEASATYYGYYPYSADASFTDNKLAVTLPATQKYTEGGFAVSPMVATYTGGISDASMTFQHPFAVLKVSAKMKSGIASAKVTAVNIEGNKSEVLAGKATIDLAGVNNDMTAATAIGVALSAGKQSITLNCSGGVDVTAAEEADFYVAIPAGKYDDGFKFTFTADGDDVVVEYNTAVTVARGEIVGIDVEIRQNIKDVQFVANSPELNGYTFIPEGELSSGKGRMIWVANEKIGFFSTRNNNLELSQVGGSMNIDKTNVTYKGEMAKVSEDETIYAYSPYAESATLSLGKLTVQVPAVQNYMAAGNASLPAVAAFKGSPADKTVNFHNICGQIRVDIILKKGSTPISVKSIKLSTATGGKLSGAVLVNMEGVADITDPTTEISSSTLTGSNVVTLDCGDGVLLNSDTPVSFWFAVAPVEMEGLGFIIDVTLDNDKVASIFHADAETITRSTLLIQGMEIDNIEGSAGQLKGKPVVINYDENTNNFDA